MIPVRNACTTHTENRPTSAKRNPRRRTSRRERESHGVPIARRVTTRITASHRRYHRPRFPSRASGILFRRRRASRRRGKGAHSSHLSLCARSESTLTSDGQFSGPTRFLNALYRGSRPPDFVGELTQREMDEDVLALDARVDSSASRRRRRAGAADGDDDDEEIRRRRRLKRNDASREYRRKKARAKPEAKMRSEETSTPRERGGDAEGRREDVAETESDTEPAPTMSANDDGSDDGYHFETADSVTSG